MSFLFKPLKNAQLRELCLDCGFVKANTKDALITSITKGIDQRLTLERPYNILSIDMGVKNLAFCELQIASKPIVNRWSLIQLEGYDRSLSFEQPSFAKLGYQLLSSLVDRHQLPEVILIEQQRFRSNGLGNVPEWIVRVNQLEAMIHAFLRAFIETSSNMRCHIGSISPTKVMNYWVRNKETGEDKKMTPNIRYSRTKSAKTQLVSSWMSCPVDQLYFKLKDPSLNPFDQQASSPELIKKKDDLSDALLQGLAWVRWQRNVELLSKAKNNDELAQVISQMLRQEI